MSESFTTQDPSNSSNAKKLLTRKYIRDAGGFATLEDQEVPHGTEPDAVSYLTLESEIVNNQNIGKSRRHVTTIGTPVAVVDRNVSEPDLGKFAVSETTTDLIVAAGTAATSSFLGLGSEVKEINTGNAKRTNHAAASFGSIVQTSTDDEGHLETSTTAVVAKGTAVPADTAGVSYEQTDVSQTKALLTTKALSNSGASAWSTWEKSYIVTSPFTFPSYLGTSPPLTVLNGFVSANSRSAFSINWNMRYAFTLPVQHKIVETIIDATTKDGLISTPASILQLKTIDLHYEGVLFQAHLQNFLTDGFTLTCTLDASDGYYVLTDDEETLSVAASGLTTTDYLAKVAASVAGTTTAGAVLGWHLISDDVVPWKYNLYKRKRTYVKLL